jgi:hypothetical protein
MAGLIPKPVLTQRQWGYCFLSVTNDRMSDTRKYNPHSEMKITSPISPYSQYAVWFTVARTQAINGSNKTINIAPKTKCSRWIIGSLGRLLESMAKA